ncbi:hypothetical protein EJ05DRAFT_264914 [Pseudovirgaria hyperparasitica]|uniref:Altered inheritance of mitochondria protein 21 n=1 Tax=Pseudovirgaria hyperparasitica TaxID=470096 RepID=A0A6A6WHB3_9PEZI|nr:uncharacterized protein EJ05DRAFT_264914 [Pseudovirgaria hyperparasitica]KAF2761460.1 hypothetical protein EJ05DRAFT_264914 [Pseudovirgaria hyperparasitica]
MMSTPSIPPRPNRGQNLDPSRAMETPSIPPRPKGKRGDNRSVSPGRTFARSPLNDPSFVHTKGKKPTSDDNTQIRRPPSVSQLPSIGQEGHEYMVNDLHPEDASPPEQTKSVSRDLPLHAPTASVSAATAKARISGVTRPEPTSSRGELEVKARQANSQRSGSSAGDVSRPASMIKDDDEHGIPQIGFHVPMYPNAGDVQAPTPSQLPQHGSTGVGFFNNGAHREGRQHTRTKSGRKVFQGPPGSYGMHGHGMAPRDPLEKSWYDKHPEDAKKEAMGEYGPKIQDNRKEYHMSQDDLNKLVHHRLDAGTPAEEVGYKVSEEYQSRMASPAISTENLAPNPSQNHLESPLRKVESNTTEKNDVILGEKLGDLSRTRTSATVGESRESLDLVRTKTQEDRWAEEHGYHAPILAADEVAKHEFPEFMQPAVSPEFDRERRRSAEFTHGEHSLRKVNSRPESRNNGSLNNLSRFSSREQIEGIHTPLDNVQEYEPLFPEDDDEKLSKKKPNAVEKLKRPDLARYHFPSQDVWEDAPSHVHLSTTVETPEPEAEEEIGTEETSPRKAFEKPEDEAARKETITKQDQLNFIPEQTKKLAKTHITAAIMADMPTRPGLKQRFPSRDIWEDAPDDVHQYTTVDTPEDELDRQLEPMSPDDVPDIPTVPARPTKSKAADGVSPEKKAPVVPGRPKPQIPARPTRAFHRASDDSDPFEKTVSTESADSTGSGEASTTKQKPQIPTRPGGSKLAALKAGFMSDLNSRLQLGPQAPKVKEPEKEEESEKAVEPTPLADARKGRAKGPSRRKPGVSPSGIAPSTAPQTVTPVSFSVSAPRSIFSISNEGVLSVPTHDDGTLNVTGQSAPSQTSQIIAEVPLEQDPASTINAVDAADGVNLTKAPTAEQSTQTGQLDIRISSPTGEKENVTAYVGGNAHEDGDVVIDKDGVEHVSGKSAPASPTVSNASAKPVVNEPDTIEQKTTDGEA